MRQQRLPGLHLLRNAQSLAHGGMHLLLSVGYHVVVKSALVNEKMGALACGGKLGRGTAITRVGNAQARSELQFRGHRKPAVRNGNTRDGLEPKCVVLELVTSVAALCICISLSIREV
ncbi:unnamed protein product [Fusarium graminearum]|nr:unnamed protein product [Fusarium graminearum]